MKQALATPAVAGLALAILGAGAAQAQSGLEWYTKLGAGFGAPSDPEIVGGDTEDVNLGARVVAGLGVEGPQLRRFGTRFELEVNFSGNALDTDLSSSYNNTAVLVNAIVDYPINRRVGTFLGGGVGFGSTELDLDDGLVAQDETDGIGQVFIGGSYRASNRVTLDAAVRRISYPSVNDGGIAIEDANSTDLLFTVRFKP